MGLLDLLGNLLAPLFGGKAQRAPPLRRMSLIETLALLDAADPEFSKKLPELMTLREESRDAVKYLAYLFGNILRSLRVGDEYGVWEPIIARLTVPGAAKQLEKLRIYREFMNLPYYVAYVSVFIPMVSIGVFPAFRIASPAAITRVMAASKTMGWTPLVFIAYINNLVLSPEVIPLDRYFRSQNLVRFPGPRLYYNIDRCMKCEETDDGKLHCTVYVEDDACYDLAQVLGEEGRLPSVNEEIIYLEKWSEKDKERGYVRTKMVVAFAYNLAALARDEDIYRAWGLTI
ncbi:MAG: hypothetical protein GXO26_04405 [Crenarchaeota archaeon]|nr:hypothetical protein [Thermoproteota archaeon]